MAAQLSERPPPRVALIGRDDPVRAQLRSSLSEAGAHVAFESDLRDLSIKALRESGATTLIVNLEPGSEDALEAIDEMLLDPLFNVIFNESEASGQLSGWDLARWARHLVAKALGSGDATPPPPPGSELLPARDLRPTQLGMPLTPAQEVGEVALDSFAAEARGSGKGVPRSERVARSSADDGIDAAKPADAATQDEADVELAPLQIERTDENVDPAAFELDFDAIENSLSELGDGGDGAAPRRLGPDEPTVVLSRAELQEQARIDAGERGPRRLGPDDPTTVLDLDEVEASLAALDRDEPHSPSDSAESGAGLDAMSDDELIAPELVSTAEHNISDSGDGYSFEGLESEADGASGSEPDDLSFALDDSESGMDGLNESFDFLSEDAAGTSAPLDSDEVEALDLSLDADVAALAAQLDAMEAGGENKEDSDASEFGFSSTLEADADLDLDLDSGAALSDDADSDQAKSDEAELASEQPRRSSGFGALSLAGLDDEVAPAAPAKTESNFDFSSINLSLEPTEDESAILEQVAKEQGFRRIIVLGASIGGPDAVRNFLAHIPPDFPALFLLAQHLESGFFARLAQQLQKTTALQVRVADDDGGPAKCSQVVVIPSKTRFVFSEDGAMEGHEYIEAPRYKPCIDDLLHAAADAWGKRITAIIFSGMAGDAVEGASYVTAKGGEVWAQDPESCVVSSMVDGAVARGVVEFIGSPRELAERCVAKYG